MLTTLVVAGAIAVGAVLAFVAVLWRFQERIVFQPPGPPFPENGTARRLDYVAADGQPLLGYFIDGRGTRRILIVFHGNADLAAWRVSWATEVAQRSGCAVFVAEYRGYGGLTGTSSYGSSALDAQAAYAVARDSLGFAPGDIGLFGHSLGSAVAVELAREVGSVPVLVLQAPLTSAREMAGLIGARVVIPFWGLISRVHYDTEAIVRSLEAPVWVAHGEHDTVVPLAMGRRVFAAARVKGEMLVVPRAGHNDIEAVAGEAYWDWLTRAVSDRSPSSETRK